MAGDTISVLTDKIFDAVVTLAGGKVESSDILNYKRGGFVVRSEYNQGAGDIEADYELESWDPELGWIPEPLAGFEQHPDGTARLEADRKTTDTFKTTQAEKYRVTIDPTGGTSGPIKMVVCMQTEE